MLKAEYSIGGNPVQVPGEFNGSVQRISGECQVYTRRVLLAGFVTIGAAAGLWSSMHAAQMPQAAQARQDVPPDNPNLPSPEKRALEENEKDIKKKVERLYQLATELKAEVDKTDSSKVLSLSLLKKTEEIEKLARDIRNRSKG